MKKIVIIDDEYIILQGLKHLLDWHQHGYEIVLETQSPQVALDYIHTHHVDIVLSDIVMPEMSGLELLQRIKISQPHIHVIIISSHSDFEYTRQALRYGASDYILKVNLKPEIVLNVLDELPIKSGDVTQFDMRKSIIDNLKSYIQHQGIYPQLSEYFKYPYYSIFFVESHSKDDFQTQLESYLHLILDFGSSKLIIINSKEQILIDTQYPTGYKLNLSDLEQLPAYYEIYLIQKEMRFYNHDAPYELDLNFSWKLRPPFTSKVLMSNPVPSQFYSVLDQLFIYTSDILKEASYSPLELKSFVSNSLYQMVT